MGFGVRRSGFDGGQSLEVGILSGLAAVARTRRLFQKRKKKNIEPCLDARVKEILIDLLFTSPKRHSFIQGS